MKSIRPLALALALGGCSTPASAPGPAPTSNAAVLPPGARIVELTHPFDDKTPYWPDKPPSSFQYKKDWCGKTPRGFFVCLGSFSAPDHGGTHLDAPIHFAEGHATVDKIPLTKLVGPAVVIDMTAAAQANVDAQLSAADVQAFEKTNGPIERGAIILVRTGWAERWPDRKAYYGDANPEDSSHLHFPGIGEEAAKLFVQRGVGAVGIDGPSVEYGPAKSFPVHQILLGADIPQFENVASLKELPTKGALVIALPMLIGGGTGGPLHIIAILPGESKK
jgi:kynurenine formamidase